MVLDEEQMELVIDKLDKLGELQSRVLTEEVRGIYGSEVRNRSREDSHAVLNIRFCGRSVRYPD